MIGYWNNDEATAEVLMEPGKFRTGDLGKLTSDGFLAITGRVKSQFKLENGKYVSPAPLEENVKLSPYVEGAVLDGRNMVKTFLIIHPNMKALKSALGDANISFSSDDAEMCKDQNVKDWLLTELKTNNMVAPAWKGYETAGNMIFDHE